MQTTRGATPMHPVGFLVLLCSCAALLVVPRPTLAAEGTVKWRVAVIGAGVGGASTAYNLRNVEGLVVDVFEPAEVGGRAQEFVYNGESLELGASIIWDKNLYLLQVAHDLNLTVRWRDEDDKSPGFGIWDGQKFVLELGSSWASTLRMVLRYGPALKLYAKHVGDMWQHQFRKIYDLQASNVSYSCPEDLLRATGLYDYTQTTAAEHIQSFLNRWWIWGADRFRNELAAAINRVNYNQGNAQLNALAGLISFAPASGGRLWSVEGGNSRLADAMLAASGALVKTGRRVTTIQGKTDRIIVYTSKARPGSPGEDAEFGAYDAVVVAAPLESAGIVFEDLDLQPRPSRTYQPTVTTFVHGKLQASYFGVSRLVSETVMLSEGTVAEFSSISDISVNGTVIYKVFSNATLPAETLLRLFGPDAAVLAQREWAAYPCFSPPERFSPFLLAPGVFYNNAIETAASAMEMSAIAARNSALLVIAHLTAKERAADAAAAPAAALASPSGVGLEAQHSDCPHPEHCPAEADSN